MKARNLLLATATLALAASASAHTGAGAHAHAGFATGFLHPLGGADHLAAMLAVGMWSALSLRSVWLAPAAFVALLAGGTLAGFAGIQLQAVEPMIAASLLALGLLVALRARLPLAVAASLAGLFAVFHGAAHGAELAGGGAPALAGLLAATALLHLAGIALGRLVLARERWLPLASGGGIALLGATLLARAA